MDHARTILCCVAAFALGTNMLSSSIPAAAAEGMETLTVTVAPVENNAVGHGIVSDPSGAIGCDWWGDEWSKCSAEFSHGETITLTATEPAGQSFVKWEGCASAIGKTCTMVMDGSRSVLARFHDDSTPYVGAYRESFDGDPVIDINWEGGGSAESPTDRAELWIDGPRSDGFRRVLVQEDPSNSSGEFDYAPDDGDGTYKWLVRLYNTLGNHANSYYLKQDSGEFIHDSTPPNTAATGPQVSNNPKTEITYDVGDDLTGINSLNLWVDGPGPDGMERVVALIGPAAGGSIPFQADEGAGDYHFSTQASDHHYNLESLAAEPDLTVTFQLCRGFEHHAVDHLRGSSADQVIRGTSEDEVLCGMRGDDRLIGGGGADVLVGGPGRDTVSYSSRSANVTVTAGWGDGDDGAPLEGDTIDVSVETVVGGSGDDDLSSWWPAQTLIGGSGDDVLRGGSGNDSLTGGKGRDKLWGDDGIDTCRSGERHRSCERRRSVD